MRFHPSTTCVGGLPLRLAVAVGYPGRLADRPESDTDSNLAVATDLTIPHRYHGDEPGESVGTVARLLGAEQGRAGRGPTLPRNASLNVAGWLDANEAKGDEAGGRGRTETIFSNVTAMSGRTGGGVREVR